METKPTATLAPLHPGLSFGQRLLRTGAAADVVLQALDEGLFEGVNLNAEVEGSPLSEHWVRKNPHAYSLASLAVDVGVDPRLDWPLETNPARIALELKKGWDARGAWFEHALIRLVKAGLDPLQRWNKAPGNLLEWAAENERPWLLRACLDALPEDQRRREVDRKLVVSDEDDEDVTLTLSRMHMAMKHATPLVAQVWFESGADLHQSNPAGETPIFYAASVRTLKWALEKGADASAVSFSGELPLEAWRRHVRDADEWQAMQAIGGTSRDQTLALMRSAVAKADLSALQKSYELLDDPAVTFKNGKTVLQHVAEVTLMVSSGYGRSRHKRVELNKMLRYLWTRTDLSVAQSWKGAQGMNGAQVAWVASMTGERVASNAASNVIKKVPFDRPRLADVTIWADGFFEEENDKETMGSLSNVRKWILGECSDGIRQKKLSLDELESALQALVDHARLPSVSSTEGVFFCNALIPVFVEMRDTNRVSDEQASRFMAIALKALGLQARTTKYGSSNRWTEEDYRQQAKDWSSSSTENQEAVPYLTALVFGMATMGVRPPREQLPSLVEDVFNRSEVQYHPDIRPVLPLLNQEILDMALDASAAVAAPPKSRL